VCAHGMFIVHVCVMCMHDVFTCVHCGMCTCALMFTCVCCVYTCGIHVCCVCTDGVFTCVNMQCVHTSSLHMCSVQCADTSMGTFTCGVCALVWVCTCGVFTHVHCGVHCGVCAHSCTSRCHVPGDVEALAEKKRPWPPVQPWRPHFILEGRAVIVLKARSSLPCTHGLSTPRWQFTEGREAGPPYTAGARIGRGGLLTTWQGN
jgi:hypothetical protein